MNKITIILGHHTISTNGADSMNLLKKLLNNYKQKNYRHQFENILQQASEYELIEPDI